MEETRGADRRSDGNHQRSNAGAAELEEETICRRGVAWLEITFFHIGEKRGPDSAVRQSKL